MQLRGNGIWLGLILLTGLFTLLYLWSSLFPGAPGAEVLKYFSREQVDLARNYARPQRLMYILSFLCQVFVLIWVVFGRGDQVISAWVQKVSGPSYWLNVMGFFVILWVILQIVNLPFSFYTSFIFQHQWGFSNQTLSSWWSDWGKGALIDLFLSGVAVALLFIILNKLSRTWWLIGAAAFSAWLIIQNFLWPILVAPLFNTFTPARDPAVISMVQDLSRKSGLPIDKILIMDASQRSKKANAYFAGVGKTKRIVLYDTLLSDYPQDEVKAVIAHEMTHWQKGHILKGLILGVLGSVVVWRLLYYCLRSPSAHGLPFPPSTWAVVLLFFTLTTFVGSPIQNYLSREMEMEADRGAVALTGDAQAATRLQIDLAHKNLSDVAPARFIEWFSYTHPDAVNRIQVIKEEARELQSK